jgi:hypothetical protein
VLELAGLRVALELGKDLFDRIEIGTVGRQEDQVTSILASLPNMDP